MTVAAQTPLVSYTGAGTVGPFSVPFRFLAATELLVRKTVAGVTSTLNYPADFSAAGVGEVSGGAITLAAALASGATLRIERRTAPVQTTTYAANDPFPASSHERALDRLTLIAQENAEKLDRAVLQPPGEAGVELNAETLLGSAVAIEAAKEATEAAAAAAAADRAIVVTKAAEAAEDAADAEEARDAVYEVAASFLRFSGTQIAGDATITMAQPVDADAAGTVELIIGGVVQVGGIDFTTDGTNVLTLVEALDYDAPYKGVHKGGQSTVSGNMVMQVDPVFGTALRSAKMRWSDHPNLRDAVDGVGQGIEENDTDAVNLLFNYLNTQGRKSAFVSRGRYLIGEAPPELTGQFDLRGVGDGSATLKGTGDFPILSIDARSADRLFGSISDLNIEGSNSGSGRGSDDASCCIRLRADPSSVTGVKYWTFQNLRLSAARWPILVQKTGGVYWNGFYSLSAHGYNRWINCVVTPTGPCEYGFHAPGTFGLHSQILGGAYRGYEACMRLGGGGSLEGVGDILLNGVHFLSSKIGLEVIGPLTAGVYNENLMADGCQFDNITEHVFRIVRMQNFRLFPCQGTNSADPEFIDCDNYIYDYDGGLYSVGYDHEFGGNVVFDDENGPRYDHRVIARGSDNVSVHSVVGGNVLGAGASLDLHGGAHPTLASVAQMKATRHIESNQGGTVNLREVSATGRHTFKDASANTLLDLNAGQIVVATLPSYANDAAAAIGGIPLNGLYRITSTGALTQRVV